MLLTYLHFGILEFPLKGEKVRHVLEKRREHQQFPRVNQHGYFWGIFAEVAADFPVGVCLEFHTWKLRCTLGFALWFLFFTYILHTPCALFLVGSFHFGVWSPRLEWRYLAIANHIMFFFPTPLRSILSAFRPQVPQKNCQIPDTPKRREKSIQDA